MLLWKLRSLLQAEIVFSPGYLIAWTPSKPCLNVVVCYLRCIYMFAAIF